MAEYTVSKIMYNGDEYGLGGGGDGRFFADVIVAGGGGGGGGRTGGYNVGQGGGNGGDINYVKGHIIQQTNDIVIGCGGDGGHCDGHGCAGGMSKFGCLVANGGNGGISYAGENNCNAQYSHLYNRIIRGCVGNPGSCSGGPGGSSAVESGCGVNYCTGGDGARGFVVCLANCISLSIGGGGPGGYGIKGSEAYGYDGGASYPGWAANGYGGGGGGGICGGGGGNGYQGIVIVQYPTDGSYGFTTATGGDTCVTCNGYKIHCFTTDGTFTIVS